MSLESRIHVIVRDNQSTPVSLGHIENAYGLSFTTILPGGCGYCTFRAPGRINVVPTWANYGYEVRLLDGGVVFWAGRMEDIFGGFDMGGEFWEITAYGWGVHMDDQIDDTEDVANTVTSTAISNFITNWTSKFDVSTIAASGYTIANAGAVTLKLLHGRQMLAFLTRFGDSAFNTQQWHVYPQPNGDIEITVEDRPTTADIYLSLRYFESFRGGLYGERLANQVQVRYNGGASTATRNDTTLQGAGPAGWGFIRTFPIVVPEIVSATDAAQIGDTVLTEAKTKRLGATALTLKRQAFIIDPNGYRVEPWRVRAGDMVQIPDLMSATGAVGSLQWNNSFVIAGTRWDEDSQILQITPERHDLSLQEVVAKVKGLIRGRHSLAGSAA